MKTWEFFEIMHGAHSELNISCTNPLVLRWVYVELKKVITLGTKNNTLSLSHPPPEFKGRSINDLDPAAPENYFNHLLLKDLGFKGAAAFLYIATLLCEAGWEPFGGEGTQLRLRRSIEKP